MFEKTENKQKGPGLAHFLKKIKHWKNIQYMVNQQGGLSVDYHMKEDTLESVLHLIIFTLLQHFAHLCLTWPAKLLTL